MLKWSRDYCYSEKHLGLQFYGGSHSFVGYTSWKSPRFSLVKVQLKHSYFWQGRGQNNFLKIQPDHSHSKGPLSKEKYLFKQLIQHQGIGNHLILVPFSFITCGGIKTLKHLWRWQCKDTGPLKNYIIIGLYNTTLISNHINSISI